MVVAWCAGDNMGDVCSGRVKVRYPNVGGEEPKQEQSPGISEAENSEKVNGES